MERLTERDFRLGFDDSIKLPSYEAVYERLREYENAEQDGRLLELSCKAGDTVYVIITLLSGKKLIGQLEADVFFIALCMMEKRFGKTVFLAREEAEAALIEMENQGKK